MRKSIAILAIALSSVALGMALPAQAKGPGWKTGGGMPPGFSSHGAAHRSWASVPPGWNKGKKKGWNGGNVPPGWSR